LERGSSLEKPHNDNKRNQGNKNFPHLPSVSYEFRPDTNRSNDIFAGRTAFANSKRELTPEVELLAKKNGDKNGKPA
jgi:hypothetical protein